jgi:hypothetical protein
VRAPIQIPAMGRHVYEDRARPRHWMEAAGKAPKRNERGGATRSVMDNPIMVADILIWESTNALLLIPVIIGMVMLVRWIRGRPVFTEKDWLFLFGHAREKVLSLHLWLRMLNE